MRLRAALPEHRERARKYVLRYTAERRDADPEFDAAFRAARLVANRKYKQNMSPQARDRARERDIARLGQTRMKKLEGLFNDQATEPKPDHE